MAVDAETCQAGWRFRLRFEEPELVLQVCAAGESAWADLYGFRPEPVPKVELEVSNWFTTTHPMSRFVRGICVSRHEAGGSRKILTDWDGPLRLIRRAPGATTASPVSWADVPSMLVQDFGLAGISSLRLGPNRAASAVSVSDATVGD